MRDVCEIEGCSGEVLKQAWCLEHYRCWMLHGDPVVRRPWGQARKEFERLASVESDECVLWLKTTTASGYGRLATPHRVPGWSAVTHLALEWRGLLQPSPEHMALHGPCRTPACMNYKHLRWGTAAENAADRHRDGTALYGESNPGARLTEPIVREIHRLHDMGVHRRKIAACFDVKPGTVTAVINGQIWARLHPSADNDAAIVDLLGS